MSARSADNPRTASAADALGRAAARVEGVPDGAGRGGVAGDPAPCAEHGLRDDVGAGVEFADGNAAVVEGVGARPRVVLLSTL